MKITGIRTVVVNAEMRNWIFVRLDTDQPGLQEEMVGAVPWYNEVLRGPIRMVGGYWEVPEAPGLGVEIDEAVAAKHPFKQKIMAATEAVLPDGTIVDW